MVKRGGTNLRGFSSKRHLDGGKLGLKSRWWYSNVRLCLQQGSDTWTEHGRGV